MTCSFNVKQDCLSVWQVSNNVYTTCCTNEIRYKKFSFILNYIIFNLKLFEILNYPFTSFRRRLFTFLYPQLRFRMNIMSINCSCLYKHSIRKTFSHELSDCSGNSMQSFAYVAFCVPVFMLIFNELYLIDATIHSYVLRTCWKVRSFFPPQL